MLPPRVPLVTLLVVCVQEFNKQDPSGPWRLLLDASRHSPQRLREVREALMVCTRHLHVFVPNKLLRVLGLSVSLVGAAERYSCTTACSWSPSHAAP